MGEKGFEVSQKGEITLLRYLGSAVVQYITSSRNSRSFAGLTLVCRYQTSR